MDESRSDLGLIVLCSTEAPTRSGAFIAFKGSKNGTPQIFGRGVARADDRYVRMRAVFQRPGENLPLPPLESVSLSRVQLEIRSKEGALELKNVGKCALSVNGVRVTHARVAVGDFVSIGSQLLLLCAERPQLIPSIGARSLHLPGAPNEYGIVGESPAARQLEREIRFVSARAGHVLIQGATGTGKELVAAAIHHSSRPGKQLISRNAGTLPETLIDAELFGNAKGYPNFGMPERKGLVEAADRSSLFLDEFAELPLSAQTHLLRVMDAGEFQRLGETQIRHSKFRLIAATNRPLTDLRSDVLARFAFRIRVPTLAERREDIPLVARHLLRQLAKDDPSILHRFFSGDEPRLTTDFVAALVQQPLDGNAREVRNLLWSAIATSPENILIFPNSTPSAPTTAESVSGEPDLNAAQLEAALQAHQGSIEKTWRALGLSSRFTLMRLMKKNALQIQKQPRRG